MAKSGAPTGYISGHFMTRDDSQMWLVKWDDRVSRGTAFKADPGLGVGARVRLVAGQLRAAR